MCLRCDIYAGIVGFCETFEKNYGTAFKRKLYQQSCFSFFVLFVNNGDNEEWWITISFTNCHLKIMSKAIFIERASRAYIARTVLWNYRTWRFSIFMLFRNLAFSPNLAFFRRCSAFFLWGHLATVHKTIAVISTIKLIYKYPSEHFATHDLTIVREYNIF